MRSDWAHSLWSQPVGSDSVPVILIRVAGSAGPGPCLFEQLSELKLMDCMLALLRPLECMQLCMRYDFG